MKLAIVAIPVLLGLASGVALAEDKAECRIVSINGKSAGIVVELNLKVASLGESRCKLSGMVEAGKAIKADPKYCAGQNGGKAEVVYYWGTADKHVSFKEQQTCPFDPRKKK